jgi:L-ascorbate metabolism protein UlaG (beta-lactamase superfamily)
MKITFLGHSTILAHIGGKNILFNPFITPNELASQIDVNELKVDYILVSHGHEDHVADVESIAKRTGAIIVSNFEITTWFEKRGCQNVHPMNIGGQWQFDFGNVRYVNAIHSSTMPDGASGGMPGGFVISSEDGNFYFAGDTALTYDMKLIPRYAKIDFAVLPIGDNFTMGFEDAVVAAQWVNTAKVLAVHFDTFGFIKVDHEAVKTVFNKEQIELILPEIGSTYNL